MVHVCCTEHKQDVMVPFAASRSVLLPPVGQQPAVLPFWPQVVAPERQQLLMFRGFIIGAVLWSRLGCMGLSAYPGMGAPAREPGTSPAERPPRIAAMEELSIVLFSKGLLAMEALSQVALIKPELSSVAFSRALPSRIVSTAVVFSRPL